MTETFPNRLTLEAGGVAASEPAYDDLLDACRATVVSPAPRAWSADLLHLGIALALAGYEAAYGETTHRGGRVEHCRCDFCDLGEESYDDDA